MSTNAQNFTISANSDRITVLVETTHLTRLEDLELLDNQLVEVIEANPQAQVCFDFNRVEYFSSGILGWLAAINAKCKDNSGPVHLCRLLPRLEELCRQVGLDNALCIEPPGGESARNPAD